MTIKKINYSWILIFTLILCISFVFTANAQVCQEGQHKFKVTLMHKAGEHTPGERVYTCEICGYTYSEEISPTGHVWSEWVVDKEPTQNEAGHRYRYCIKYSHKTHYQEEEIPPLVIKNTENKLPSKTPYAKGSKFKKALERNTSAETALNTGGIADKTVSDNLEEIAKAPKQVTKSNKKTISDKTEAGKAKTPLDSSDNVKGTGISAGRPGLIASLLVGEVNAIDVLSSMALTGMAIWYAFVIEPMYAVLRWIKKKKAEADMRMRKS
jgi:hypothetical protein